MENLSHVEKAKQKILIDDDFDQVLNKLDKMEFSAITEGLGFHDNKFQTQSIIKTTTHSFKTAVATNGTTPSVTLKQSLPVKTKVEQKKIIKEVPREEVLIQAKLGVVFLAWMIDLICVSLFFASNIALLILVSGVELKEFFKILPLVEISSYCSLMFVLYYLFYFTILDSNKSSTIGKAMLGLQLKNKNTKKELLLKQKLIRSIVSLGSIFLLGLPYIFNIHELLTDTIIAKRKND